MGTVRSLIVLTLGAAIGVAVSVTYRVMQETGKPLQEAISDLPLELEKLFTDVRAKTADFIATERNSYESGREQPDKSSVESVPGQQ